MTLEKRTFFMPLDSYLIEENAKINTVPLRDIKRMEKNLNSELNEMLQSTYLHI